MCTTDQVITTPAKLTSVGNLLESSTVTAAEETRARQFVGTVTDELETSNLSKVSNVLKRLVLTCLHLLGSANFSQFQSTYRKGHSMEARLSSWFHIQTSWKLRVLEIKLHWICEWLNGHQQRVVWNGKVSPCLDVISRVPQGSILGSLLFLIIIRRNLGYYQVN